MTGAPGAQHTDWDLEVLVSAGCSGCGRALAVVEELHSTHPHVRVRVTDVDEPGWVPPPGFVGTPMFLVGGQVLSLGNPTSEVLWAAFGQEGDGPAHR
jgi:hypothetical protein